MKFLYNRFIIFLSDFLYGRAWSGNRTVLFQGRIENESTEKTRRYCRVIGVDRENALCFGSVLVNTNLNPKAQYSAEYLSAQYKLKRETYPEFLDYDSYVDCGELFSIPIDRLKLGEFFGFLTDEDRNGIFDLLETSDIFSTKQKKRYGIHRR